MVLKKNSQRNNQRKNKFFTLAASAFILGCLGPGSADALDLDWTGSFRTESHLLYNSSLDTGTGSVDATRRAADGYYIPSGGQKNAFFQTLFLRLKPSVIVNDNVSIKTEWWVGDPIYSAFGGASPYSLDQRQFFSTQSRGSAITAQRYWAEILSDLGTFQVGRVPLNWGLGIVWNGGDKIWDRYMSTGDAVRLVSKFGSFSFSPSLIKYSQGNNLSGACLDPTGAIPCSIVGNGAAVTDLSLMFKYDNLEEDITLGVNFIHRLAGGAQDPSAGWFGITGVPTGFNYNIWDIYGSKKLGKLTISGELPITSGSVGPSSYKAIALATETKLELSDVWQLSARAGRAPGQSDILAGETAPGTFRAFFFNPGYKLGLIMFNYQLANMGGPNSLNNPGTSESALASPFDNPIVNAKYLNAGIAARSGKWQFRNNWIFASALETASSGGRFFNVWERKFVDFDPTFSGDVSNQKPGLGWEMDWGTSYFWDDALRIDADLGWYFPGDFYRFSNTPGGNAVSSLYTMVFRLGILF